MSIIGKPLLAPGGGGISKYFLVNDTLSNDGIIRDIELVDGQPKIQSSKSVTITTAGTTYISPDSGYDALERADVIVESQSPTNSILDRTISGNFEDSTLTEIGDYAFYYCSSLTSASFPNCTTIGIYTFYCCYYLATASFPNCTTIESYAFYMCSSLTTASFPNCTTISNYAFYNCASLTSASFPNCTTIGSYAFRYCYNLISLYLTSTSVCSLITSNAFSSTPIAGYTTSTGGQYGSIYVPSSLLSSYKTAANWSYYSDRFVGI